MIWSPVAIGIVAGLGLVLFGSKRVPALAKSLGLGVKNFREGLKGEQSSDEEARKLSTEKKSDTHRDDEHTQGQ